MSNEKVKIDYDINNVYIAAAGGTGTWYGPENKTIQITDVSTLTNVDEFTTWLTANATKQGGGGGGTVIYSYVALADA